MLAEWSMKKERETDLKSRDEGKEDHGLSQQIKLNNFTVSLWDKRKEVLYPISIAMEVGGGGLVWNTQSDMFLF